MLRLSAIYIIFLFCVATSSAQTTAFIGVNVIPMDRERVLANQIVVIKNGVIVDIGDAVKVKIPIDAVRIVAAGKYLIPGLVDMHTHLLSDGDEFPDSIAPDELRVMIANGVTTVRFMIGTPELLVLRSRSAKGEIVAPTIYVTSPHLTGREQGNNFVVNTPEEARDAVRKSKAAGYDFIKVTTFMKSLLYETAVDEAKKLGIRVVGHADSRFVGAERAWKAGQQIEHLDGYMEMLLRDDAPMKGSVSDLYLFNPDNWKSFDHIDETKIAEVARRTVASNRFVNPTQHFMKNTFGLPRSEESIRSQPDFRFYPKAVQERYLSFYKSSRLNQISFEKRAIWVGLRDKLIKAIHDAGGKIMAGSDTPEFLWLYGYTMHRELKALADAGLSNYTALEAATKNPSMFFGTLDKVGTIEKGRRADLILLKANPLENISATENRAGVMLKGKWYPQTELDGWLDEISPRIANSLTETASTVTPVPEVFGKDVFSGGEVFRGSFAPDGKTFYFFKKVIAGSEEYRIFTSELADGKWTKPVQLDLGGDYSDIYPSISKDGRRLVFSSYRPAPGDTSAKPNAHLWYVDKKDNGWDKPVFLAKSNNLGYYHSWVEFGWDEDIYFQQTTPDWKSSKNLIARWNGKEYTEPVLFEEVESWKKWNPEVRVVGGSPGVGKEIIFLDVATRNPKTGQGASDIYFSLKKDGKWTEPKPLGANVNSDGYDVFPFFSPDNQYLYFVRDFKEFYRVPLKMAIDSVK